LAMAKVEQGNPVLGPLEDCKDSIQAPRFAPGRAPRPAENGGFSI
jgi:hypothetical protein